MRIVWNIVANAGIVGKESMIGAMRLIDKLSEHSHDIYEFLDRADIVKSEFAQKQIIEEKEKVQRILKKDDSKNWEEVIIEAERYAFFKGAVRFMFTTADGSYDWDIFEDRLEKSKQYFDASGISARYRKNALLLRLFIYGFTKFDQFHELVYDNKDSTWKDILTNKNLLEPICKLFTVNIYAVNENFICIRSHSLRIDCANDQQNYVYSELCESELLSTMIEVYSCKLREFYGKYILYISGSSADYKRFVIDERNEFLFNMFKDGKIECTQKTGAVLYFWGRNIYFRCNSRSFRLKFDTNEPGYLQETKDNGTSYDTVNDDSGNDPVNTLDKLDKYIRSVAAK
jgi:hypothetical protein